MTKGRYIYHYCAAISGTNNTFSGIAQLEKRITSQADLNDLKLLVSTQTDFIDAIISLSFLGREIEEGR